MVNERIIQNNVWKRLWKSSTTHRVKLFAWRCIHDYHPTRIRLDRYNSSIGTQYAICDHNEETMEHLLFHCRHARTVWRLVNVDIDEVQRRCDSVSVWVESWFLNINNNDDDRWLATLMITAWILWKDRCNMVFQGVKLNPFNSMHRIQYHLHSHLLDKSMNTSIVNSSAHSQWNPHMQDVLKFNVDASFDEETNTLGTDIVLCSHAGNCEGIKGFYIYGVLSPGAGECMDIQEPLLWAREKRFTRIHIEADAKLVVQSITDNVLLIQWGNIESSEAD
ncbi:uncharacterized protein LOC113331906 [Papaver somniferum]|uniref:uncharacterized protein LOC113331906 n=1 Tax=Papaver somniferum TaxID=3469 RepID=UPI000E6F897C|nr:uncharacterized protein LOC113331906 [Papaver somniferum]